MIDWGNISTSNFRLVIVIARLGGGGQSHVQNSFDCTYIFLTFFEKKTKMSMNWLRDGGSRVLLDNDPK